MRNYILVFFAVLLLAMQFALSKVYERKKGSSMRAGLRFNAIVGIFTFLLMWAFGGFKIEWSTYSFIMAILMALFTGAYTLLSFRIFATGKVAVYTQFLMLGGMILPYIYGIFFLEEEFSLIRLLGLVLLTVSVLLSGADEKEGERKGSFLLFFVLLGAVFLLNGGCSIVSKLHQIEGSFETVSATGFVAYTGLLKTVISLLLIPFFPKEERGEEKGGGAILIIFLSALASGVSYLFQLYGASSLPATVLYPMITGGTVVLTALAGWLCFGEKLRGKGLFGIILCFLATLLFL